MLIELLGPVVAERRYGGTPWHPHHIAERYGLLVIIALGEGLLGTIGGARRIVIEGGWTDRRRAARPRRHRVTFGMWWTYFVIPSGDLLSAHRERAFGWGYGHIPLFGALVAVGAGLHVAAYYLERPLRRSAETDDGARRRDPAGGRTSSLLYLLYAQLTRTVDPFHLLLIAGSAVVLGAGGADGRGRGVDLTWSLLVLALTPWVTVVGYETVGHRHNEEVLGRAQSSSLSGWAISSAGSLAQTVATTAATPGTIAGDQERRAQPDRLGHRTGQRHRDRHQADRHEEVERGDPAEQVRRHPALEQRAPDDHRRREHHAQHERRDDHDPDPRRRSPSRANGRQPTPHIRFITVR